MKNNIIIKTLLLVCLAFTFTTCKKVQYSENDKKVRKPQRYDLMRGFITSYKVNGIDSLDLLNSYFPTNYKKIQEVEFQTEDERYRNYVGNAGVYSWTIKYEWNSDYKYIYVYVNGFTHKNIFTISGANWKILKLEPSKKTLHHSLKISSTFNGNTYEIQFN